MPDWSEIVRSRLAALGLDAEREEEIRAELAGHLEDAYADARRCGCPEEDAVARALERVPDWAHLARTIRCAGQREEPMSHDTKTLWLPGMSALCCAAAVLLGVSRLLPPALWADPRAPVPMGALLLSAYLAFGALGASWSRRAGGSIAARFFSGIFPLALHVWIFVTVIVAAMFERRQHPEHLQLGLSDIDSVTFQLRAALIFIVIPGIAMAIGTLPFLRNGAKT